MSRSLSLFCPPELELLCLSNIYYIYCITSAPIYIYIHCAVLLLYILFCSGKYLRGSEHCTLVLSVWILGPFRYKSLPVFSALDS